MAFNSISNRLLLVGVFSLVFSACKELGVVGQQSGIETPEVIIEKEKVSAEPMELAIPIQGVFAGITYQLKYGVAIPVQTGDDLFSNNIAESDRARFAVILSSGEISCTSDFSNSRMDLIVGDLYWDLAAGELSNRYNYSYRADGYINGGSRDSTQSVITSIKNGFVSGHLKIGSSDDSPERNIEADFTVKICE